MGFWAIVDCLRIFLFHLCKGVWNRMTCRQKALCVSCCSLIVIILIFLWVRIGLMGCRCPKQFDICETTYVERPHMGEDGMTEYWKADTHCECLCDGNFFTCEYTCPGCGSSNQYTGEPYKLPQAGCCWGEDGSWGSDKEREGCSIQYCGQAPCDGQDIRDASNTHWTQDAASAMEVMWPVLLPFALIACICYAHRRQRGRGPTDAAPTPAAAPSPALGAQEVARAAVQPLSAAADVVVTGSGGTAAAAPGSAPDPVLQGLNVLLGFFEEESEGEAEADPGSAPDPVLQGLNVLLGCFEEESEGVAEADEGEGFDDGSDDGGGWQWDSDGEGEAVGAGA